MCQSYSRYWDTKVNKNKITALMELPFYYKRNLKNKQGVPIDCNDDLN